MPLIDCDFSSVSLGVSASVRVILPQEGNYRAGVPSRRYPTLWLLHGLSDDHTAWTRQTAIERHASQYQLAVVMPAVNRSYYADMEAGPAYFTYVSEELPTLMRAWFPLSAERADNFVAGLSMGGFGAFKLALNYPDRYAAAASLSGALMRHSGPIDAELSRDLALAYGTQGDQVGSVSDIYAQAEKVARLPLPARPALYQWCGVDDFPYECNLEFREHASNIGLDLLHEEGPGGHTWDRWDACIERVLNWLPLAAKRPIQE